MKKVNFDYSELDQYGLIGPDSGKVSLAFEFCIPRTMGHRQIVHALDSTIQFSQSPGRIGCSKNEYSCIGQTKEDYQRVLTGLSELEFVESIERCYFE